MKRDLFQKTYPGEYLRPSMEAEISENGDVVLASTPWGNKDAIKELQTTLKDYFLASLGDSEATSPYAQLTGLSASGNRLRMSILLANESILKKYNKEAYNTSCESIILTFNQSEMSWVQVGQPHLLLMRQGKIIPLSVAQDLCVDYLSPTPLPTKLLGLDRGLEFETKNLLLQEEDRIIMLARSTLPQGFFSGSHEKHGQGDALINHLHQVAAKEDPKIPFWIGLLE